jgi:hypothetical protein
MNALKINYWAVIAAAVAAFVLSSVYYSPLLLGNVWRAVDPRSVAASPSPGKVLGELCADFRDRLCARAPDRAPGSRQLEKCDRSYDLAVVWIFRNDVAGRDHVGERALASRGHPHR